MVKQQTKTSTIVSLCLHIGVVAILLIFGKPISILVPSRSDGIEVSLVSMPNQNVQTYQPQIKAPPAPVKVMDTPADINVKQQNQVQPKPTPKAEQPKVDPKLAKAAEHTDNTKAPAPTNNKAKLVSKKVQVNDLLGDVLSENTTSVRKGKALGGNPNGTSDSNNLIGNYADQVINAVRPFVLIPDDVNPKAKAIVKVVLNPNLSVRSVSLTKSSGNAQYDQNVQNAIMRLKVFPPLPDNANYVDFRILNLTFRPQ